MPLIFGTFLAGALLSCLLPITLLICFAAFFYRQARRAPENAAPTNNITTTPEPTNGPGQPLAGN